MHQAEVQYTQALIIILFNQVKHLICFVRILACFPNFKTFFNLELTIQWFITAQTFVSCIPFVQHPNISKNGIFIDSPRAFQCQTSKVSAHLQFLILFIYAFVLTSSHNRFKHACLRAWLLYQPWFMLFNTYHTWACFNLLFSCLFWLIPKSANFTLILC